MRAGLARLELRFDRWVRSARGWLGLRRPPVLLPYRGYVGKEKAWLRARVIERPRVTGNDLDDLVPREKASLWRNLHRTYHRYQTDELPGQTVHWSFGSASGEQVSDDEGFVDIAFPARESPSTTPWLDARISLEDAAGAERDGTGAALPMRCVSDKAHFGVISDIDDTIVYTGATNFVKHWRTVVAHSAHGRQSYDHVSTLYRALAEGEDGPQTNPFFYVSSSPWNLYDLFEAFMKLNDIPAGPMLLKDFGLTRERWLTGGHLAHKTQMIERLLAVWPDLPFVLIGDSGQQDLDVYCAICEQHPGRIEAVIIHDVKSGEANEEQMRQHERLTTLGVPSIHTSRYRKAHHLMAELELTAAP